MRKVYWMILLFGIIEQGIFAQSMETKVTKPVTPISASIPVVFQDNVKGGFHQVENEAERNNIDNKLQESGMIVWQQDVHSAFQWDGVSWRQVQLIRNWEEGSNYYVGDLFIYNQLLFIAQTNGSITSGDTPLNDAVNWKTLLAGSLESGKILVGNGSGLATAVDMSGDVAMDNTGKTTVSQIQGVAVASSVPSNGQVLLYDGVTNNQWVASDIASVADGSILNSTLYWDGTAWVESSDFFNTNGNLVTSGDISVNGGDLMTGATAASLFNSGATSLNIGGASDNTLIGSSGSTASTTIANNLKVGNPTVDKITMNGGDLMVEGDAEIDGTLWAKDLQTSSDRRLKTNVKTLEGVIPCLNEIRGVRYEFKDQNRYSKGTQVGVIAQELQAVYPELVSQGADGYLTVNYPQLTAVLLQAIKEQQEQLNQMRKEINTLKEQISKQTIRRK